MILRVIEQRFGHRTGGIALLAVAVVLMLIAAWRMVDAVMRWRATAALAEWRSAVIAGDVDAARSAATSATSWSSAAAAVLASIDLTNDDDEQRLEALMARTHGADRDAAATALALAQALRKHNPTDAPDGADGTLAKAIAAVERGEQAEPPHTAEPASGAMARAAAQRFARAAWRSGDREAIARDLGAFALMCPRHPDGMRARAVLAALDRTMPADRLSSFVQAAGDPAATAVALRACMRLVPDRADAIARTLPRDQVSAEDEQSVLEHWKGPLSKLVAERGDRLSPATATAIGWACVDDGERDLALKVAERAGDARRDLQIAVACARGDIAALRSLDPSRTGLAPRTTPPVSTSRGVTFHVATAAGLVPDNATVTLDGRAVPSENLRRWDSLVLIPTDGNVSGTLQVTVGGQIAFDGMVSP